MFTRYGLVSVVLGEIGNKISLPVEISSSKPSFGSSIMFSYTTSSYSFSFISSFVDRMRLDGLYREQL